MIPGFYRSQVVQDFSHQQYVKKTWAYVKIIFISTSHRWKSLETKKFQRLLRMIAPKVLKKRLPKTSHTTHKALQKVWCPMFSSFHSARPLDLKVHPYTNHEFEDMISWLPISIISQEKNWWELRIYNSSSQTILASKKLGWSTPRNGPATTNLKWLASLI